MATARRSALYLLAAATVMSLAGQTPPPTFSASTKLIQVNVIVHNKKGDPVTGLVKDHFILFDQGARQRIVFFSDQCSSTEPSQPAAKQAASAGTSVFSNRPTDAASTTGSVTAILFDSLNTDFADTGFARARVEKFLKGIQPEDRVALYGLSTKLQVLHDFTGDADALAKALDRFKADENLETSATKFKESNMSASPVGPYSTIDRTINDMNQKRSDLFMAARAQSTATALEVIARHLAGLPGRKNLIWVSGSFPISIGSFQKHLQGASPEKDGFSREVEAAARALSSANIAIYPVDARALTTLGGVYNAATSPQMGAIQLQNHTRLPEFAPIRDIGTMQALADATGGRVFENTNDIEGAVRSAIDDSRCTYVLSYYPNHNKWDGTFREIKVQLKQSGVETRYRRGYTAFPDAPLDQNRAPLSAASVAAGPIESTELELTVEIEPQAGPVGARAIKAHLRFDTSAMRFEQKDSHWVDALDVLWVQLAADGGVVLSNGQTLTLKLSPETYAAAAGNGVRMSATEAIAEQTVALRFVARDGGTGAVGSVTIPVKSVFASAK